MRILDVIQAVGTVGALAMAGFSLYLQLSSEIERVEIAQSEDGGGEFVIAAGGVVQEVEFHIVNNGSSPIIVKKIDVIPGNVFPAPVLIDDKPWDGRPFRIEPESVLAVTYLASRRFDLTEIRRRAQPNEALSNPFWDRLLELDAIKVADDRLDSPLWGLIDHGLIYDGGIARELQTKLNEDGYTFAGENSEAAEYLAGFDMYVTFGGPCLTYLQHTLSVCTSLELTTAEGNTFSSEYIGFGLRSAELDREYRETNQ